MKNLAIIPARGGSKRIPRKNLRNFHGKPIIEYSIAAAHESGLFDRIMVSTDDEEIKQIALGAGAECPFFRSPEGSDDQATLAQVVKEVVESYAETEQITFENICCILATAPFLSPNDIKSAYLSLVNENLDSILSVAKYDYPVQRALIRKGDLLVPLFNGTDFSASTQSLPEVFHDAGQFYWIKSEGLRTREKLIGGKSGIFMVPGESVQDIDDEDDWSIAEFKYAYLQRKLTKD